MFDQTASISLNYSMDYHCLQAAKHLATRRSATHVCQVKNICSKFFLRVVCLAVHFFCSCSLNGLFFNEE